MTLQGIIAIIPVIILGQQGADAQVHKIGGTNVLYKAKRKGRGREDRRQTECSREGMS